MTWQNQQWVCTQPRLRSAWASAQSDQSWLCAQWVAKDPRFLHADSGDSDQTGLMPRLIWVFAGCKLTLLVLSCRGSYVFMENWQKLSLLSNTLLICSSDFRVRSAYWFQVVRFFVESSDYMLFILWCPEMDLHSVDSKKTIYMYMELSKQEIIVHIMWHTLWQ